MANDRFLQGGPREETANINHIIFNERNQLGSSGNGNLFMMDIRNDDSIIGTPPPRDITLKRVDVIAAKRNGIIINSNEKSNHGPISNSGGGQRPSDARICQNNLLSNRNHRHRMNMNRNNNNNNMMRPMSSDSGNKRLTDNVDAANTNSRGTNGGPLNLPLMEYCMKRQPSPTTDDDVDVDDDADIDGKSEKQRELINFGSCSPHLIVLSIFRCRGR